MDSQIAVGADFAFTQACRTLAIPQHIFLSQPAERYLSALGSDGTPDFTPTGQGMARDLFEGPQVIEHRVVTAPPTAISASRTLIGRSRTRAPSWSA
ncbi:MAG TPA: hypothetical protein VES73_07765 [Lamprocystis sp. (in: g-proteobacteria)]|nr:hypothetical protein [Lamprocystis sp. (in: g-proteobacteria)]